MKITSVIIKESVKGNRGWRKAITEARKDTRTSFMTKVGIFVEKVGTTLILM